ncbi:hypothetical protein BC938DRAFT_478313 [Jimgerdemannia flammicorona]|uniref:Uncharacterized protein n=1 Tax=Jimgerdemannia flammicorona TaxID=994334 RepID=A0A433QN20_9FUNG|nr:hypothetical protein BC938DRAFT_478313 [Jimgerdemannia flammicorona]
MSDEEDFNLEVLLAELEDYDYIEHIIYSDENSNRVKCYKVIPDNVPDDEYNFVHVVRTKYRPLPFLMETPQVNSKPPVMLQVQIVGTVCWTTLGDYGNWIPKNVPKNEVCPDIRYPTDNIFSAKLSMGLRVDEATKTRLETVDQDIRQELVKTCNEPIEKWNKTGGSGNLLTVKSSLVMLERTWKKYQEEEHKAGNRHKECVPPLTPESDPSYWFRKYAPSYAVVDKDCQPRFFKHDNAAGEIAFKRTEIKNGDIVKALVNFKTYLFHKEGQLIGGVMVIFDEVELLERKKQVRLREKLRILKRIIPDFEPSTPTKKGRYKFPSRGTLDDY